MKKAQTTSPHIGRRVSVFPEDARLPERRAVIVGGSRQKGFVVRFEDNGKVTIVGPTGYRYISPRPA